MLGVGTKTLGARRVKFPGNKHSSHTSGIAQIKLDVCVQTRSGRIIVIVNNFALLKSTKFIRAHFKFAASFVFQS